MNKNRIYISEFESEEKLKNSNSFSLPSLRRFIPQRNRLKDGMDGLTIVMAETGDTLITKQPLSPAYLAYWRDQFCPLNNWSPKQRTEESGTPPSIYQLLQEDETAHAMLHQKIVNYALVPEYYAMCETLGIAVKEPPLSVAARLNRKSWSNDLRCRFDLPGKGVSVSSISEFEASLRTMLESGTVLVKDSLGVSGQGILPVESARMAERLIDHFKKQQEEGRTEFDFVLEMKLNRTMDFSCQFEIDPNGNLTIDGFQKNRSRGYAYDGSGPLDEEEMEMILASGYEKTIERIARAMAEEGYHGFACVDSMIADHNQVIPLLEINPRMSMGRFNLNLQKKTGRNCQLSYLEGLSSGNSSAEQLLGSLETNGLLYTRDKGEGIIPLAPNTWEKSAEGERVRIYSVIVYDTGETYEKLSDSWINGRAGGICSGAVTEKTAGGTR